MQSFDTIGILGFGNMGEAIARGVLEKLPDSKVLTFEKQEGRAELARSVLGDSTLTSSPEELVDSSQAIILAIKPQDSPALLAGLGPRLADKILISIMAGKTLAGLRELAGARHIVRSMPNLAAARGQAFSAVAFEADCPQDIRDKTRALFDSIGTSLSIPENLMPAFTGISGSGIAFAFEYLHAMALAGAEAGFAYEQALRGSVQVMRGAMALLEDSEDSPTDFITRICSPNGTTIEGMQVLRSKGFAETLGEAVQAAARRSRELES